MIYFLSCGMSALITPNGFGACAVWLSELPASIPPNVYMKIQMFISKAKEKLKVCAAGNKLALR